jgi:hypothetical protein
VVALTRPNATYYHEMRAVIKVMEESRAIVAMGTSNESVLRAWKGNFKKQVSILVSGWDGEK